MSIMAVFVVAKCLSDCQSVCHDSILRRPVKASSKFCYHSPNILVTAYSYGYWLVVCPFVRSSVFRSVTLVDCDHTGWNILRNNFAVR